MNPNQNRLQSLSTALARGLISQEQYEKGKIKLSTQDNSASNSKLDNLNLALERGLITPQQFEIGKSKLQNLNNNNEDIGKTSPEDDYSLRREKSLKKLEGFPDFVRGAYENYLYPSKEKIEEEQKSSAKNLRNLATLPGAILDLPSMAYNIPAMLAGKKTYVPSQMIGEAIDTATNNYTSPETGSEKINEALIQSVLPMGAIAKGAGYLSKFGPQAVQKIGNFFKSANAINPGNVAATAAGAAGTQHFINQNPEANPLGALGAGIISSYFGGKAGNNAALLTRPNAWVSQKFGINPEKVSNQLVDQTNGNFIPTTLADLSDSVPLQMVQNSLEKTPLIGKKITSSRNEGLRAEKDLLNKQGLNRARESEQTGELALEGAQNYEDAIKNRDIKNYKEVEEGIKTHAIPFEGDNLYKRHKKSPPKKAPEGKIIKDNYSGEEFILTPGGDFFPIINDPPPPSFSKKQSERKIIERYTNTSIDDLSTQPLNLVPFPNTKKFIGKKFQKIESPEAQHDLFKEKFGEFTKRLDNIATDYNHSGIPYNSFQSLRKSIDDAITTWGATGKVSQEELKRFRNSMHKDTANYLESIDPSLKLKWEEANKLKSSYLKKDQPLINDIRKVADKGSLEDVTKSLLSNIKNAGRKVNIVSKGLNDKQKNILGYSLMNQIGKGINDSFDLFTFSNNFKKMKGNGKNEFLQLFPEENRNNISRLARRMGNIQETLNQGNKSGTSYYNKIWSILKNPVKSVGGYAVSIPFVNLYSNPKFINWISAGALINKEKNLNKHIQKLKTLNLGSNVLNDEIRSLYERLEEQHD